MSDLGPEDAPTSPRARSKRLRVLLLGLLVITAIHLGAMLLPDVVALAIRRLSRHPGLTDALVRDFLDGKPVYSLSGRQWQVGVPDRISIEKERISSLDVRADSPWKVVVRFDLDHDGKRWLIDGIIALGVDERLDGRVALERGSFEGVILKRY